MPDLFSWILMIFACFAPELLLLSMCVLLRENGVLLLVQVVLHGFCCYILLLLLCAIFKEYVKFLCVLLSGIMMLPVCFYGFGMVIYRVFCFQGFWLVFRFRSSYVICLVCFRDSGVIWVLCFRSSDVIYLVCFMDIGVI